LVDDVIWLRFTGGPLDGRGHMTRSPEYEYRVSGGAYRRGRTHRRTSSLDHALMTHRWRSDDQNRPAPAELVSMW